MAATDTRSSSCCVTDISMAYTEVLAERSHLKIVLLQLNHLSQLLENAVVLWQRGHHQLTVLGQGHRQPGQLVRP